MLNHHTLTGHNMSPKQNFDITKTTIWKLILFWIKKYICHIGMTDQILRYMRLNGPTLKIRHISALHSVSTPLCVFPSWAKTVQDKLFKLAMLSALIVVLKMKAGWNYSCTPKKIMTWCYTPNFFSTALERVTHADWLMQCYNNTLIYRSFQ